MVGYVYMYNYKRHIWLVILTLLYMFAYRLHGLFLFLGLLQNLWEQVGGHSVSTEAIYDLF